LLKPTAIGRNQTTVTNEFALSDEAALDHPETNVRYAQRTFPAESSTGSSWPQAAVNSRTSNDWKLPAIRHSDLCNNCPSSTQTSRSSEFLERLLCSESGLQFCQLNLPDSAEPGRSSRQTYYPLSLQCRRSRRAR
jgi:hypothetical protein